MTSTQTKKTHKTMDVFSAWGEVYEILLKRGTVMALADAGLLVNHKDVLQEWSVLQLAHVAQRLREKAYSDWSNQYFVKPVDDFLLYLSRIAFGQGYTYTREYLKKIASKSGYSIFEPLKKEGKKPPKIDWELKGIWCPLTLPGDDTKGYYSIDATETEMAEVDEFKCQMKARFYQQFQLPSRANMQDKGYYGRSDFLAVIRIHNKHYVLVQEYSYFNGAQEAYEFDKEDVYAYLMESKIYNGHLESKSVFSYINAEAEDVPFSFSNKLKHFLPIFAGKDKIMYKLCQGSSYATTFADAYREVLQLEDGQEQLFLDVFAMTSRGANFLSAEYRQKNKPAELEMMQALGVEYRKDTWKEKDEALLKQLKQELRNYLITEPLRNFPRNVKETLRANDGNRDLAFTIDEDVEGFYNPNGSLSQDECFKLIDAHVDEDVRAELKAMVEQEIEEISAGMVKNKTSFTLRDLHKNAVILSLKQSQVGKINYLCFGGTPGIGKTSSVKKLMEYMEGFFFFYASPRVMINDDVAKDLSKISVTLMTNSDIVQSCKNIYQELTQTEKAPQTLQGAVLVKGLDNIKRDPKASIYLADSDAYHAIENPEAKTSASIRLSQQSESTFIAEKNKKARVFESIGLGFKQLWEHNCDRFSRASICTSTQAFMKYPNGGRTLNDLALIFNKDKYKAMPEKLKFARQFPHIVVMFDEITGDEGCRGFIDEMHKFLDEHFIRPFGEKGSPITITMILADASLSNENAMRSYMRTTKEQPSKMMISKSEGAYPFKMTRKPLFQRGIVPIDAIYVMANCFPAKKLSITYKANQYAVPPEVGKDGLPKSWQATFRKKSKELSNEAALDLISQQLEQGQKQIIYFAQDKEALAQIKKALVSERIVPDAETGIYDSQISAQERARLNAVKEDLKVILITSTAARGISFPNCDSIIAVMPRFEIESSLMEITQLVFRGRGGYETKDGQWVNGDQLDRKITVLIQDFYPQDAQNHYMSQDEVRLKNTIDMLTIVLMIRGTLLTRIKGDAGFYNNRIAMIPVGKVHNKSNQGSLSKVVQEFYMEVRDATYKLHDSGEYGLKAIMEKMLDKIAKVFNSTRLTTPIEMGVKGYGSFYVSARKKQSEYQDWVYRYHTLKSLLINSADLESGDSVTVPYNVYITGPNILENRTEINGSVEHLSFHRSDEIMSEMEWLRKKMYFLLKAEEIKSFKNIPRVTQDVLKILNPLLDGKTESYASQVQRAGKTNLWLNYPVSSLELIDCQDDKCDGDWFDVLRSNLKVSGEAEFPIIPKYQDAPFRGTQQHVEHPEFKRLFVQNNFMLSQELNLVNALTLFQ